MNEQEFKFQLVDTLPPDQVIAKAIEVIANSTRGYVTGHIAHYEGKISSYTRGNELSKVLSGMSGNVTQVDIQEDLGSQNESDHKFEVYLSAKGLDHYKYRLMFVNYKDVAYPVTIVMTEDLLAEYSDSYGDTFQLNTMQEVQNMMDKVINSKTLKRVIQNLINEALRREKVSVSG